MLLSHHISPHLSTTISETVELTSLKKKDMLWFLFANSATSSHSISDSFSFPLYLNIEMLLSSGDVSKPLHFSYSTYFPHIYVYDVKLKYKYPEKLYRG
jgi:hypothetical protein